MKRRKVNAIAFHEHLALLELAAISSLNCSRIPHNRFLFPSSWLGLFLWTPTKTAGGLHLRYSKMCKGLGGHPPRTFLGTVGADAHSPIQVYRLAHPLPSKSRSLPDIPDHDSLLWLLLQLKCIAVDQSFIHSHKLTQKGPAGCD